VFRHPIGRQHDDPRHLRETRPHNHHDAQHEATRRRQDEQAYPDRPTTQSVNTIDTRHQGLATPRQIVTNSHPK
jgi:hypothetical protein